MFFLRGKGTKWHYAGDKTDDDFELGDLTTDGDYHDLDFSALVPANAKWVMFNTVLWGTQLAAYWNYYPKSATNRYPYFRGQMAGSNLVQQATVILPLSSDKKITYKFFPVGWTGITISLMAYGT